MKTNVLQRNVLLKLMKYLCLFMNHLLLVNYTENKRWGKINNEIKNYPNYIRWFHYKGSLLAEPPQPRDPAEHDLKTTCLDWHWRPLNLLSSRFLTLFPRVRNGLIRKLIKSVWSGTGLSAGTIFFRGTFAKLRKTSISFVMSVRPRATTRLPLDGFWLNLIFELFFFFFSNVEKVKCH